MNICVLDGNELKEHLGKYAENLEKVIDAAVKDNPKLKRISE